MEQSLDDVKNKDQYSAQNDSLKITYPLNESLRMLKEKHRTVAKLHQERYEQVRSMSLNFLAVLRSD